MPPQSLVSRSPFRPVNAAIEAPKRAYFRARPAVTGVSWRLASVWGGTIMINGERLLGSLMGGGLGRSSARRRASSLGRGLLGGGAMTLLGGVAVAAFEHRRLDRFVSYSSF